jgi:hypothetical protein
VEHFGEIAGIAVKLYPGDDDIVGVGIAGHGGAVVEREGKKKAGQCRRLAASGIRRRLGR